MARIKVSLSHGFGHGTAPILAAIALSVGAPDTMTMGTAAKLPPTIAAVERCKNVRREATCEAGTGAWSGIDISLSNSEAAGSFRREESADGPIKHPPAASRIPSTRLNRKNSFRRRVR